MSEEEARTNFGVVAPVASRTSSLFPSMRQTLMLDAEDLIALFDATPVTKIGEKLVFQQADFLVPREMLEHRIEKLKKLIAASKGVVEGLSARVMKIRRAEDNVLDKTTREKFKREENQRMAHSNAKLFRYRQALRVGNYHEKIWRWETQPVYFREVVDDCMTFTEYGEPRYERGEYKVPANGAGYWTTNLVRDVIATRIFDVSRYEVMMQLDAGALRLAGASEEEQRRTWANCQRWENCVIKAAVFHGVLRPRQDLLDLLALNPYVREALDASEEIESDETENALALKTGGACYNGVIHGAGYRYNLKTGAFRRRALESFDKGPPKKDNREDREDWEDSGFGNLRDYGNDDIESFQPK